MSNNLGQSTEKQRSLIIYLFECTESKTVQKLYDEFPTHNEKYTDKRADWKRRILEDKLEKMTINQTSYIIDCLKNRYPHSSKKLVYFFGPVEGKYYSH